MRNFVRLWGPLLAIVLLNAGCGDERTSNVARAPGRLLAAPLPGWYEQQKLVALDGQPEDFFGVAAAIDGDTAVIGAYTDDVGTNPDEDQGSAYVFVRSGSTWTQQAKLVPTDGSHGYDDLFGIAVAISGDTAVVGSIWDYGPGGPQQGSAYVFVRSGTTWTQQARLQGIDGGDHDQFGGAVAISGDTIVVGADQDDTLGFGGYDGSAYVFVRSVGTWSEQQKLTVANYGVFDRLGSSVAVYGDTAVLGANPDRRTADAFGYAAIFERSGSTWTEKPRLMPSDPQSNDQFGFSADIDGDTIVLGAQTADVYGQPDQGAAYVFVRNGATFTQQAKLFDWNGTQNDLFGRDVGISGDTIAVGAYGAENGSLEYAGVLHVFSRSGTQWTHAPTLAPSDTHARMNFAGGVDVDGDTIVAGATDLLLLDNAGPGAGYVFEYGVPPTGGSGGMAGAGGMAGVSGAGGTAGGGGTAAGNGGAGAAAGNGGVGAAAGNGGVAGSAGAPGTGGGGNAGSSGAGAGGDGDGTAGEAGAAGDGGETGGVSGSAGFGGAGGNAGSTSAGSGGSRAGSAGAVSGGTGGGGNTGGSKAGGNSESSSDDSGCGCKVAGAPARSPSTPWLAAFVAGAVVGLRRRSSRVDSD